MRDTVASLFARTEDVRAPWEPMDHRGRRSEVPAASLVRAAPERYRHLCAGIGQPHRWWPIGRGGSLCLTCSRYERG